MSVARHGLQVLVSPKNIETDIVAVPGLGADPSRSFGFGDGSRGFNWLRDEEGIPSDFPTARVLLYHYDSRWIGKDAKEQTLRNAAELLLDSLIRERKDEKGGEATRPLLFLAHSLGGLVVAKALTLAAERPADPRYSRISECFAGGIFFGTPFRGAKPAAVGVQIADLASKLGVNKGTQLLHFLNPENDGLAELRDDFSRLISGDRESNIACIFELGTTSMGGLKKLWCVLVTEESACLDGRVEKRGWNCDHRQLNRFENAKDDRYKFAHDHIQRSMQQGWALVAKRLRDSKNSVVSDEAFSRANKILGVVNHEQVRDEIENLSGDSSWILADETYKQWVEQAHEPGVAYKHRVLWACGTDESGKSKAALAVIDDIEARARNSGNRDASAPMVAYFFCNPRPDFSSAEAVVKSFLWQLIVNKRSLGQYVKDLTAKTPTVIGGRRGPEEQIAFSKLWAGLAKVIDDPSVREVFFVINNIHRLGEQLPSTKEFLDEISTLLRTESDGSDDSFREKARWMILSSDRNEQVNEALQERGGTGALKIAMAGGSGSGNPFVRSFIRDEVEDLAESKGYSLALRYFVLSSLNEMAPSSTTWVEVVCSLLGEISTDFILVRKTLEEVRAEQDAKQLMRKIWREKLEKPDEDIHTTKEILRTLAVAYEDPTHAELRVLAGLVVRSSPDDPGEAEREIRRMIRACGPLLKLHAGGYDMSAGYRDVTKVGFIHAFAKETLLEPEIRRLIGFHDGDGMELRWQHGVVGLRCFSHMLKELGAGRGDDDGAAAMGMTRATASSAAEIDALFDGEGGDILEPDAAAVLGYPLRYWLKHGNEATSDFVSTLGAGHIFWSPDSRTRKRWWRRYTRKPVSGELEDLTALHVAAHFGVLSLVKSLLDHGHKEELCRADAQHRQPLHLAAASGHVDVCKLLLEQGADVNGGVEAGKLTPLHMAAYMGHIGVVDLLVEKTADINAIAEDYGTPLALALSQRQTDTAERLLDLGADPGLAAGKSESPLAAAALRGYDDLVEKLLAKNPTLIRNSSALAAAASAGNIGMVKRLLPLDKDLESRGDALVKAASSGFDDVVDCILQTSSPGPHCDKAFKLAASHGHEDVVRKLWEHRKSRPAISAETISQALYDVTVAQNERLVTYLIETCGADANGARGKDFGDALTASAFNGTETILQILLRHGASVNAPEGHALQTAALRGYQPIVQILLEHGADPNAWSDAIDAKTALQAACNTGHPEIAEALIKKGANPELGGGTFSKPLIAATSRGYADVVRLLLQAGANPNVSGGPDESTPLINAAMTLPEDVLGLLIDRGAAVDEKDPAGDTALIAAAWVGDRKSVALLLDRGADIHSHAQHRGTALHAAASRGYVEVCRLLLERGADPTARCGPFDTVLQAAAASGNPECVEAILGQDGVQVNARGGKHFTALHAAATHGDDRCLRLLLALNPDLDAAPPPGGADAKIGTPLQAAAFAGCSRNARLLVQAGADPNITAGKHGTALQAAALKCGSRLCAYLLDHGAKVDGLSGKYWSALAAAVARRDDASRQDRLDVLSLLLERKDFHQYAYWAALLMALRLGRRHDFELILESRRADAGKNLAKITEIRRMMAWIRSKKAELADRQAGRKDQAGPSSDGYDSDFGDDIVNKHQDIYDDPGVGKEQFDPFAPSKTQPGAGKEEDGGAAAASEKHDTKYTGSRNEPETNKAERRGGSGAVPPRKPLRGEAGMSGENRRKEGSRGGLELPEQDNRRAEQSEAEVPAEDQQRRAGKRAEMQEQSWVAEAVGGPDTAASPPASLPSPASSLPSPLSSLPSPATTSLSSPATSSLPSPPPVSPQPADSTKRNGKKLAFSGVQKGFQDMKNIPSIKGIFGKK